LRWTYGVTYTPTGPHVDISIRLHGKHIQNSPFSLIIPTLTLSQPSLILSVQLASHLAAMLPVKRLALTHLGTCQDQAAFTPSYFWSLVKDKGGILVIVRNTNGHVFGGYVQDVFTPISGWKIAGEAFVPGHDENFVFTLGGDETPTVKLSKTPGGSHGVCMGAGDAFLMGRPGGHDVRVDANKGNFYCNPSTYTTIAPGYPAVPVDDTHLAGSQFWQPEVIEVWMCS
jgi:hypothetical protein